jgi:hypothetical protein
VWGRVEKCETVVKNMSCKCHKLVCEEHITHLRPFEEPCVGCIAGKCELCGKQITGSTDKYSWLPTELFEKLKPSFDALNENNKSEEARLREGIEFLLNHDNIPQEERVDGALEYNWICDGLRKLIGSKTGL